MGPTRIGLASPTLQSMLLHVSVILNSVFRSVKLQSSDSWTEVNAVMLSCAYTLELSVRKPSFLRSWAVAGAIALRLAVSALFQPAAPPPFSSLAPAGKWSAAQARQYARSAPHSTHLRGHWLSWEVRLDLWLCAWWAAIVAWTGHLSSQIPSSFPSTSGRKVFRCLEAGISVFCSQLWVPWFCPCRLSLSCLWKIRRRTGDWPNSAKRESRRD